MRTTEMMVEALIEARHQGGEVPPDHFWQLAERFRADLVNQALAMLGNQADAEDIAQDSLCQAFVDLAKLEDPTKLGSWLRRINRCNVLDLLRRRKTQREQRLTTGAQAALTKTSFPNRQATPEFGTPLTGAAGQIVRAVDSLPESYREVVVLHYWEKLTLAQIAERLGLPPGTVRSRIARADGILLVKLNALRRAEEHPS
ncbi:MAG: sigma-70 family RNA polymerase sigma factor [Planctomycetota bacterium]|nr:sigma-70 family RNA polymerase sigma factor [Planctomycetota bacterium]